MEILKESNEDAEKSIKYAQQHLANERTFLAWMRTAISFAGVGFLTTSLHFAIRTSSSPVINTLAISLGIFACIVGLVTGVLCAVQYTRKRKDIQRGFFIPSNNSIIFVSGISLFLILLIFLYLSFLLFST